MSQQVCGLHSHWNHRQSCEFTVLKVLADGVQEEQMRRAKAEMSETPSLGLKLEMLTFRQADYALALM